MAFYVAIVWLGLSVATTANGASDMPDINPAKVHVVFMSHLDLGFTDTTRNVCDRYFDLYFPQSLNLSSVLRSKCAGKGCPAYRWTQFPWLMAEFLDGAAGCAHRPRTPSEVVALEQGIARDDIVWHANPVNLLTEISDVGLFDYGLKMRNKLNDKYGKKNGRIAGQLADVTGMSRSAVPWLARNGVKVMHIGYNGVGGLPIVMKNNNSYERGASFCGRDEGCPSEAVFMWKEPKTGEQIVMMIEDSYGVEVDVPGNSKISKVHSAAAPDHVLILHYTMDNSGVPTEKDVVELWQSLGKRFPKAAIELSTLDDFAEEAFPVELGEMTGDSQLPLVTQELGDSWLYGGAADPMKLATFREARRALTAAVAAGRVETSSWQYDSYMRRLLKGPAEHNWGFSTGSVCSDCRVNDTKDFGSTWPNDHFAKARYSAELQRYDCPAGFSPGSARWGSTRGVCGYGPIEQEWAEQREWMHPLPSWSALRGWDRTNLQHEAAWNDFVHELEGRLLALRMPQRPSTVGMTPLSLPSAPAKCGGVSVGFDHLGAINYLQDVRRQWADANHTLGSFRYVTYSQADFDEFMKEWDNHGGDFAKPGMSSANPESLTFLPIVESAWANTAPKSLSDHTCRFVMQLTLPGQSHTKYGAPSSVSIEYIVPGQASLADVSLTWHDKTATRLPESMWLKFTPLAKSPAAHWELDVLGYPVDPLDVIQRGTRFKHAVWDGATLQDGSDSFHLRTLDTALIAPGDVHHLLRYSENNTQPDPVNGGMHANLHNNLWGTAFPQWYDDDGIARFQLIGGGASKLERTDFI